MARHVRKGSGRGPGGTSRRGLRAILAPPRPESALPDSTRHPAPARRFALALGLLALLAIAAYQPVFSAGFLDWDDDRYLAAAADRRLLEPVVGNRHPLTMASLSLDHALFGDAPLGYHVHSLAWHLLNIGLVAGLCLRLGAGWIGSLAVAVAFGLHPMRAESVAWVAERKDVLSTFFYLAALAAWLGFRRARGAAAGALYGACLAAAALALAAKSMAVTLPVVLLALDLREGRRDLGRALLEKLPFVALAVATGLLNLGAQTHLDGAVFEIQRLDLLERVALAARAVVFYVAHSLWPAGLSVYYDIALVRVGPLDWAVAVGAAAALAWAARADPGRRRDVLFGLAFFAVTLAPTLKLVPFGGNSVFNDRYLYLPSIGLGLAAVAALRPALARHPGAARAAVVLLAVGLAGLTWQRARVFQDSEQLWSDVLSKYPGTALAHNHLGVHYLEVAGDVERAEVAFLRAAEARPELPEPHVNLARVREREGDLGAAEAALRHALSLRPASVGLRRALGDFYLRQDRLRLAATEYEAIADAIRDDAGAQYNLGLAYGRSGRLEASRRALARAVELDPSFGAAHASLGLAHLKDQRPAEALDALRRAERLGHDVSDDLLASLEWRVANGDRGSDVSLVLLVSLDTLRADHLGSYGYERPTSPRLDALARAGVRFLDASSTSTWTLPAHASLLTGRYVDAHGVRDEGRRLPRSVPTLTDVFARAGWETACVVNSFYLSRRFGLQRGCRQELYVQESVDRVAPSTWVTDQALAWIDELAGSDAPSSSGRERLFLFVHYYDVHSDYAALPPHRRAFERPYDGTLEGTTAELRAVQEGEARLAPRDAERLADLYDAGVRQTDAELGRLFDGMRERGLWDRSLIVVTSDHGEELLEHGGVLHGRHQYQEQLRVPLLMVGPGLPEDRVVETPVSLVDVAPTVLDVVGLLPPGPLDGLSLRPLWSPDGDAAPFRDRVLFSESRHGLERPVQTWAARLGSLKRIVGPDGRGRLYDLAEDPGETGAPPPPDGPAARQLARELERFRARVGDGPQPTARPPDPLSEEERAHLRALGYLAD